MPKVTFTCALQRFLPAPSSQVEGRTVAEALTQVFAAQPLLRAYVLDDQGALRRHVVIYIKGKPPRRPVRLADPLETNDEIFVLQALSGG